MSTTDNATHRLAVYLTPSDIEAIRQAAAAERMTVSTWAKRVLAAAATEQAASKPTPDRR